MSTEQDQAKKDRARRNAMMKTSTFAHTASVIAGALTNHSAEPSAVAAAAVAIATAIGDLASPLGAGAAAFAQAVTAVAAGMLDDPRSALLEPAALARKAADVVVAVGEATTEAIGKDAAAS